MTSIQDGRQNIKQNIWLITLLRSIQNHRCSFIYNLGMSNMATQVLDGMTERKLNSDKNINPLRRSKSPVDSTRKLGTSWGWNLLRN